MRQKALHSTRTDELFDAHFLRHARHATLRYVTSRHAPAPSTPSYRLDHHQQEQHQQQQQQQQPAAVFGDGLRISCAKCSRVRRDPPGRKPSKACTKKERYWFCEPCVTGSPEAFSGRGIGVCRRDGKWKLATVRVRKNWKEEEEAVVVACWGALWVGWNGI